MTLFIDQPRSRPHAMLIYPGISRTTRSLNKNVNLFATTQMNGILIRAWKGKLAHNGTRESYAHAYGYGLLSDFMLEL